MPVVEWLWPHPGSRAREYRPPGLRALGGGDGREGVLWAGLKESPESKRLGKGSEVWKQEIQVPDQDLNFALEPQLTLYAKKTNASGFISSTFWFTKQDLFL